MNPVHYLGPLIGKSRIKAGLTLEQLCNRASDHGIDLPPDHLAEIEAEERRVPAGVLYALLETLGVTLYDIQEDLREVEKRLG